MAYGGCYHPLWQLCRIDHRLWCYILLFLDALRCQLPVRRHEGHAQALVSLLLSILWLAVITIGAYLLADTLRVFIDWVTGRVVIWGLPKIIDGVFGPAAFEYWQIAWMLFAWVFYIHSLYIVGGTLFRRQQFLLTSATIAVFGILLVMILNQINLQIDFITGSWDEKTETYNQVFHPFFYVLNTTLCLLIVFHYWASYKLFTRMQVINNKWLNV